MCCQADLERDEIASRMGDVLCELYAICRELPPSWELYQVHQAAEYVDLYRQKAQLGEDGWRVWRRVRKVVIG